MEDHKLHSHSAAWKFQTWVSFIAALAMMVGGIVLLPSSWWITGYFLMGLLFLVSSCFALAKTLRDEFEDQKFINRVSSAKTAKILNEYE